MPRRFAGSVHGIPSDMFTSDLPSVRRLQVDVGQTGFWAGREFRSFYEYAVVGATPVVVKVVVPPALKGIVVQRLTVSCYQGGTLVRAWRNGTEGGVYTALPVIPNNGIPDVHVPPAAQVTLSTGGTLSGMTLKTDAVVALANSSGPSNTTVLNAIEKERGLPPGTYYIELTRVAGTTVDALGIINALWEERYPEDSFLPDNV